jgi:hypothetical protein
MRVTKTYSMSEFIQLEFIRVCDNILLSVDSFCCFDYLRKSVWHICVLVKVLNLNYNYLHYLLDYVNELMQILTSQMILSSSSFFLIMIVFRKISLFLFSWRYKIQMKSIVDTMNTSGTTNYLWCMFTNEYFVDIDVYWLHDY